MTFLPHESTFAQVKKHGRGTKPVVVLVGDSHTHCALGYNWVETVSQRHPALQVINAGVNGEQVKDVLARLEPIIACQPDYATILLGSNERLSSVSCGTALCYGQCCGPTQHAAYRNNLRTLFSALLLRTNVRRVAVMCFPPGEAPADAPLNLVGLEFIEILREVVEEYRVTAKGRLVYIPLADKYVDFVSPAVYNAAPPEVTWSPATFVPLVLSAQFKHYVTGVSMDEISSQRRLRFTTDCVHLNATGAGIVAETVSAFLTDAVDECATAAEREAAAAVAAVAAAAAPNTTTTAGPATATSTAAATSNSSSSSSSRNTASAESEAEAEALTAGSKKGAAAGSGGGSGEVAVVGATAAASASASASSEVETEAEAETDVDADGSGGKKAAAAAAVAAVAAAAADTDATDATDADVDAHTSAVTATAAAATTNTSSDDDEEHSPKGGMNKKADKITSSDGASAAADADGKSSDNKFAFVDKEHEQDAPKASDDKVDKKESKKKESKDKKDQKDGKGKGKSSDSDDE